MSDFDGNVLYFYNPHSKKYDVFDITWLQIGTYKSVPLQRTELKANRSSNNSLHRKTSPNHKSTISFTTHPMHLIEMEKLRSFINNHYILKVQRKVKVKYWCDETMSYYKGEMYMPDATYTYLDINTAKKDILYGSTEYELIQY